MKKDKILQQIELLTKTDGILDRMVLHTEENTSFSDNVEEATKNAEDTVSSYRDDIDAALDNIIGLLKSE